jgi:hypothetical protein
MIADVVNTDIPDFVFELIDGAFFDRFALVIAEPHTSGHTQPVQRFQCSIEWDFQDLCDLVRAFDEVVQTGFGFALRGPKTIL